jgi:uncharacterized membrane protein
MAGALKDSDGQTSSRRIGALIYPIPLYLGGIGSVVTAVVLNAGMWPVIGGLGLVVAGLVLQLWLFGYINATNLAEIAKVLTEKK